MCSIVPCTILNQNDLLENCATFRNRPLRECVSKWVCCVGMYRMCVCYVYGCVSDVYTHLLTHKRCVELRMNNVYPTRVHKIISWFGLVVQEEYSRRAACFHSICFVCVCVVLLLYDRPFHVCTHPPLRKSSLSLVWHTQNRIQLVSLSHVLVCGVVVGYVIRWICATLYTYE